MRVRQQRHAETHNCLANERAFEQAAIQRQKEKKAKQVLANNQKALQNELSQRESEIKQKLNRTIEREQKAEQIKAERAQAVASRYNERQKAVTERRERIYSATMQKKIESLAEQSKRFQTATLPTYNYNVEEKKKQADERRKRLQDEQQ